MDQLIKAVPNQPDNGDILTEGNIPFSIESSNENKIFIEANTQKSDLYEIKEKHIIPVFVKDNEPVISHAEFITKTLELTKDIYHGEQILMPQIRLSHPVKGRTPDAKDKPAIQLLEHEKTLYYERMAFAIEIPSISNYVNGNKLNLTIGGVKAYNLDNLYGKSGSEQHFKIFIGFENKVCTNMCVTSDGYAGDIKVRNVQQLQNAIKYTIEDYDGLKHMEQLESFTNYELTEQQFAHFIGRCRMYRYLPDIEKQDISPILFGDAQINSVCKEYYKDQSFCRNENGNINLWNLYNLLTSCNKSTYIDSFLDRALNATEIAQKVKEAVANQANCWYLN